MNKHFIGASLALTVVISGCQSMGEKTQKGVGIGAIAGGVAGAVIGHQTGNRGKGAAIGAATGALLGGVIGKKLDKQAEELAKVAETKRTEDGIVTKLKSDLLFDTGRAELKGGARENLRELATIMKKYPENRIIVVGHTDNTGSNAINQKLSEQRANTVKLELAKNGIASPTMETMGVGPSQPVADNGTMEGRTLNRRVELQITMPEEPKK